MKGISDGYPVHQLLIARALVAVPLIFVWIGLSGDLPALKAQPPGKMIVRGLFLFVAYMCFYLSIVAMPLAVATALFFTGPFFISLLSVPILGESLGLRRMSGIVLGFVGVIIILNPGVNERHRARFCRCDHYLEPRCGGFWYSKPFAGIFCFLLFLCPNNG